MPYPAQPHLLVDISAHGYGHAAQTTPVVNELARRIPGLRVTVRSAAPLELLQRRIHCEFRHLPVALDFGMKMTNAVDVQIAESAAAYRDYHVGWDAKVRRAAEEMRALQPDLLLANIPYISLAAAHAAGIRAAAMCCLNWADIYHYYFAREKDGRAIHAQMLGAYNSAEIFLKVQPAMPMPDLRNARSINPIAQVGRDQRALLKLSASASGSGAGGEGGFLTGDSGEKLVLVAMGGIEYRFPMERWPRVPGVRWLVPEAWNIAREDMTGSESLGLTFSDLLASCDAVLTKPGYGTFAEAACAGVPVLYVSRRDWPEEPCLVRWLQQNCVCREVGRERLQSGDVAEALRELWSQPKPPVPDASGAAEAAEMLAGMLMA